MPDEFEFLAINAQPQQATIIQPNSDNSTGVKILTWASSNTGSPTAAILAIAATGGTENYGLLTPNIGLNSLTNSGILKLVPSDTATDFTLTFPAITDSLLANTNTATITNKTISATNNTISSLTNTNLSGTAGITNANLANSTISGVALGSSLYGLSATSGLSGTTYDGSAASSFSLNMGNANSWTADQSFVNVNISGTLTTTGTTVYINSTVTTIKDPVITLGGLDGGGALIANDSKDRGIEFQWYDSAAKKGFFGFRRSNQRLVFIPDGTNTSEVYTGTLGDIEATTFYGALSGNATSATTAAGLSTKLAIGSGGTNATTAVDARSNLGLAIGSDVQAYDGDLAAIAALTGATGFLKKTAADTWTLDAGSYLSGNQTITVSGDASGSGTTAITLTLATVPIGKGGTGATTAATAITALTGTQSAGTYLRSDGTNAALAAIQAADVPTLNQNTTGTAAGLSSTLAIASGGTNATTAVDARSSLGLAIGSDVQAYDGDLAAIAALTGATGFLKKTAADTWTLTASAVDTASTYTWSVAQSFSTTTTGKSLLVNQSSFHTYSAIDPAMEISQKNIPASDPDSATLVLYGTTTTVAADSGSGIGFGYNHASNSSATGARILGAKENATSGDYAGYLGFHTRPNLGNMVEQLRIPSTGGMRLKNITTPVTPPTGFTFLYTKANSLYYKGENGTEVQVQATGSFLTANQTITVDGDASGSGTTAITLTLATVPIGKGGTGATTAAAAITALTGTQSAGTYLRSDGTNAALATIQAADIPTLNQNTTGTAAGLSAKLAIGSGGTNATTAVDARSNLGLAIGSDVQAYDGDLAAIAALTGATGFLKKTAADTWALDASSYLTANQTITLTGDVTGSGSTSIGSTLATISGVAGSYTNANITVDTKGRITAAASGSSGATSAQTKTYTLTGTVTAAAGTVRWYPDATITLTGAYSITSTTPSGGAFAITIRKNGTSIGTLSVAAGSYRSTLATLSISLLATDYVTIDVDTSNGAANANICILYTR